MGSRSRRADKSLGVVKFSMKHKRITSSGREANRERIRQERERYAPIPAGAKAAALMAMRIW